MPVIFADNLTTGSREISIDREDVNGNHVTVRGSVKEINTMKAAGLARPQVLATLETPDHKAVTVDLGPEGAARDVPKKGDIVEVTGIPGSINQQPVLIAQRVTGAK